MKNLEAVNKIFKKYSGIKKYAPPVTDTKMCRLHLNENLYGPSLKCLESLKNINLSDLYLYDLKDEDELINTICKTYGYNSNMVYLHNGSSEVLRMMFDTTLQDQDIVLLPNPGWSYYESLVTTNRAEKIYYTIEEGKDSYYFDINSICEKAKFHKPKIIIITSPNMPTGNSIDEAQLKYIIEQCKDSIIIVDQAYFGFDFQEIDVNSIIDKYKNVAFVRTFSKFFGLANERIGYCVCSEYLKEIFQLNSPLFKVSYSSRMLAKTALEDYQYYNKVRDNVIKSRTEFIDKINIYKGIKAYESNSNFVYIKFDELDAELLKNEFEKCNYLVRLFYNNDKIYMRITIAEEKVMNNILKIIDKFFVKKDDK